jgi:hypothetical protein
LPISTDDAPRAVAAPRPLDPAPQTQPFPAKPSSSAAEEEEEPKTDDEAPAVTITAAASTEPTFEPLEAAGKAEAEGGVLVESDSDSDDGSKKEGYASSDTNGSAAPAASSPTPPPASAPESPAATGASLGVGGGVAGSLARARAIDAEASAEAEAAASLEAAAQAAAKAEDAAANEEAKRWGEGAAGVASASAAATTAEAEALADASAAASAAASSAEAALKQAAAKRPQRPPPKAPLAAPQPPPSSMPSWAADPEDDEDLTEVDEEDDKGGDGNDDVFKEARRTPVGKATGGGGGRSSSGRVSGAASSTQKPSSLLALMSAAPAVAGPPVGQRPVLSALLARGLKARLPSPNDNADGAPTRDPFDDNSDEDDEDAAALASFQAMVGDADDEGVLLALPCLVVAGPAALLGSSGCGDGGGEASCWFLRVTLALTSTGRLVVSQEPIAADPGPPDVRPGAARRAAQAAARASAQLAAHRFVRHRVEALTGVPLPLGETPGPVLAALDAAQGSSAARSQGLDGSSGSAVLGHAAGVVRGASCRSLRTRTAGPRGWRATGGAPVAAQGLGFAAALGLSVAATAASPCAASGLLAAASALPLAHLGASVWRWRATDALDDDATLGSSAASSALLGGWASCAPLASAPALSRCRPRFFEAQAAKGLASALAGGGAALALLAALLGGGGNGGGSPVVLGLLAAVGLAASAASVHQAMAAGFLPPHAWGPSLEPARQAVVCAVAAVGASPVWSWLACACGRHRGSGGGSGSGLAGLRALLLDLAAIATPADGPRTPPASALEGVAPQSPPAGVGGCFEVRAGCGAMNGAWWGDREEVVSELLEVTVALGGGGWGGGGDNAHNEGGGGGSCLTAIVDPRAAAWGTLAPLGSKPAKKKGNSKGKAGGSEVDAGPPADGSQAAALRFVDLLCRAPGEGV